MRIQPLFAVSVLAVGLAGCGSGDINLSPSTSVNNSNNTSNNGTPPAAENPCASYVNTAGQTVRGTYDGTNCTYSPSFVDAGNNLKVNMTIPDLPNDGAHIFQGSLFVGEAYSSDAELAAAGISEGGDGPVLTIEAGATVAFASERQFLTINRGSQIFAVGRADAPITFTSLSDVNGTVGPEDVQQWGGIVIDGFGVTNACAYTGVLGSTSDPLTLTASGCHVESEGSAGLDENYYGGNNNDDSSGRLEYVVVKHTGATVGNGDELNGITFGAVGRNTIVRNLEVYSVYDDGIEFFGGAVNVENYLAMYVRDDSIDIDEGYLGTITNALVIQSETDGNHCIEADGVANYSGRQAAVPNQVDPIIAQGINSRPTINNLTCIVSPNGADTATHDPGAGWQFREAIFARVNGALLIGSFGVNNQAAANDNYCLNISHPQTQQSALTGGATDLRLSQVIFACAERISSSSTFPDGTTTMETYATGAGNVFATIPNNTAVNATAAANPELQLLEGSPAIYSIPLATSQVDGAVPAVIPATGETLRPYLGALSLSETDWTQGWTYGLHQDSRAQDLWFE